MMVEGDLKKYIVRVFANEDCMSFVKNMYKYEYGRGLEVAGTNSSVLQLILFQVPYYAILLLIII